MKNFPRVNRIEVINHSSKGTFGRVFTMWEDYINVSYDLQDSNRTLKIFIDDVYPHWTTADGRKIAFEDLENDHLKNIIKDGYRSKYIKAEADRRGFECPLIKIEEFFN